MQPTLKQVVMRRVYRAYARSLVVHPAFVHGVAFSIAVALLADAVFVRAVIANFFATPVGNVPTFIWNSFTSAETIVLVLTGTITFLILSFGASIIRPRRWLTYTHHSEQHA